MHCQSAWLCGDFALDLLDGEREWPCCVIALCIEDGSIHRISQEHRHRHRVRAVEGAHSGGVVLGTSRSQQDGGIMAGRVQGNQAGSLSVDFTRQGLRCSSYLVHG